MSVTYTVTVIHDKDPQPSPQTELREALQRVQPEVTILRPPASDPVYYLQVPDEDADKVAVLAQEFLAGSPACSAIVQKGLDLPARAGDEAAIIVQRKPGVMDPVSQSVLHAMNESGFQKDACQVRTGWRYRVAATPVSKDNLSEVAGELGNEIVDEWFTYAKGEAEQISDPFRTFPAETGGRVEIELLDVSDERLQQISDEGGLSLDLREMQTIRDHYQGLGRNPSEIELETIAQTWSEHCCHKTLTGRIRHGDLVYGNMLKETIFAVTRELDKPWCWSVFKDNAGVIAIDDEWGVSFKVETHNHPSALEPYGGAGTGIGGVIRDTLGTGLGARPVLNTDVFCFAPLDTAEEDLPAGTLHPRRLLRGVVSGVRDYGNRMGIPTANGAIHFHPDFAGNPLVFCGSVGLIRKEHVDKEVKPGDCIVAIGGRTGRDGIHGATFSSRELTEESEVVSSGAVQIGNPIEEKKVLDAILRLRDENLCRAVTDCGAGGFSSAVGEMGEETGADVYLERAPLKYDGLGPTEVWISEAQERMVMAVDPAKMDRLREILAEEEVECAVLGEFRGDGKLRLHHNGELMGEMDVHFLHEGRPDYERVSEVPTVPAEVPVNPHGVNVADLLSILLADGNVASKEAVIRQYDHEVQGRMTLRPLAGADRDAPMDGCALDPLRNGDHQVVVANGLAIGIGAVDTYQMACHAVDESLRNVVASGGTLDRAALLDNFAWGDVRDPKILGELVECSRGAADAARIYGTPFVSGKDSLHNTFRSGGVSKSIPPVLLVSAISIVPGAPQTVGSDLKASDSVMVLVGPDAALPGSLCQPYLGGSGGAPAAFDGELGLKILNTIAAGMKERRFRAVHDLSEGGLAVAAAEMTFGGGGIGMVLNVPEGAEKWNFLFGEGPHRFFLEMNVDQWESFQPECEAAGIPVMPIGHTTDQGHFSIQHTGGTLVDAPVNQLKKQWQKTLEAAWPVE